MWFDILRWMPYLSIFFLDFFPFQLQPCLVLIGKISVKQVFFHKTAFTSESLMETVLFWSKFLYFTREFVHSIEVVAVFFHIGANAQNVLWKQNHFKLTHLTCCCLCLRGNNGRIHTSARNVAPAYDASGHVYWHQITYWKHDPVSTFQYVCFACYGTD